MRDWTVLVLSWTAAFVACLGYGFASVLQSHAASRTVRAGGVLAIMFQLPYLTGLTLDGIAFLANVVALQQLPLFLVQSVSTASVGVTALAARLRGIRLRPRDWAALGVLIVGLIIMCRTAESDNAVPIAMGVRFAILGSVLLPLLLGLLGLRRSGRSGWVLIAVAAGLAFSSVALASRGISAERIGPGLLLDPLAWTIVLQGVTGLLFFALALQRGPVTAVASINFVVEIIVPSGLGLLLFDDQVGPGLVPVAVVGFVLAVVGTVALARFAE